MANEQEDTHITHTVDDVTLDNLSKDELIEVFKNKTAYVEQLENELHFCIEEVEVLKGNVKFQKGEPTYRERILSRKIAMKDQEIQEYLNQINEMRSSQVSSIKSLKSALLDPAANILIQNLKDEVHTLKADVEQTKAELNAWKFTPESNMGKKLMSKCRLLLKENEELGKMISSGRVAKVESELALQKNFSEEVKTCQSELDELLKDVDDDIEKMLATIYTLQKELTRCTATLRKPEDERRKEKSKKDAGTSSKSVEPEPEVKKEVEERTKTD